MAFINDNCFESAFQMGKAQEAESCGEVTRQVGISKVQCIRTQAVQIQIREGRKPLCLFDRKSVLGVWRRLVACL